MRKTIRVTFSINTVQEPIKLAEAIEKILYNSVMSAPEFKLVVQETKVIKEERIENEY